MDRSSGHPRYPSFQLPSSLCHPGLNQTRPSSQPPLRTLPLHRLPHSSLSHSITGPLQTPPFHSSSRRVRPVRGRTETGPPPLPATLVPRAQSEVTVIATFLDLSNSPSAFGHLHPKTEPPRGKRQHEGGEGGRLPSHQTEHGRPAHRKWGSNRCAEPHKVTWVSLTPEGATPPQPPPPQGTGWGTPPQR